jgi:uncharacterized membrane protein
MTGDGLIEKYSAWNQWYRLKSYVRSSLWIVPFVAIPLELLTWRIAAGVDGWLGWSFLGLALPGATALCQTVVTATLSFVVFTFGSLLVAIQVASGQMTPRIIATTLLRDNVVKYTVGLFIFTFLFALSALDRMETAVHQTVVFLTAVLGVLSFAAFFYLIDYAARLLRPISVLTRVSNAGLSVIDSVYPLSIAASQNVPSRREPLGTPRRVVYHDGTSQIVLAVRLDILLAHATRSDGVIEFVPQVGDFVAVGEPLFKLYGGAVGINESKLRSSVAFGSERTLEQDPTFAFRIVIDIALRALSSAINDPTTAVLALDQLHRLLRAVGMRDLRADETSDKTGTLRVICRTPNWEDFVHLAFSEIRRCGLNSLQVVRRLRAMIDNLLQTLPTHRHAALYQELDLLDRDIESHFSHPEERKLARTADSQGLGGHASIQT